MTTGLGNHIQSKVHEIVRVIGAADQMLAATVRFPGNNIGAECPHLTERQLAQDASAPFSWCGASCQVVSGLSVTADTESSD